MKEITKKYTNGEVTVVWKPAVCIHSKLCWTDLSNVFDPRKQPWVNMTGASTEEIVEQIKRCPSGALSFYMNNDMEAPVEIEADARVEVAPNGPLMVYGHIMIKDGAGNITEKDKVTAFCRCGHSSKKPFCDGSHFKAGFKG